MDSDHKTQLIEMSRDSRSAVTPSEALLWESLRNRKFLGYKFRRQFVVFPFIVDFLCHEKKLIIEIDGPIHQYRQTLDYARDRYLNERGWRVLRLAADLVINDLNRALSIIEKILSQGGRA